MTARGFVPRLLSAPAAALLAAILAGTYPWSVDDPLGVVADIITGMD